MSIRVAVADDHSIVRDGIRRILADEGDMDLVVEAASGEALLEQLALTACDVLVLDISLPGANGFELLAAVRVRWPELPILIFSMHEEEQYAVRAFRAGASGYLTKARGAEQMVAALRKVASGGMMVSPAIAERLARDLRPAQGSPLSGLSNREFQVLQLLCSGVTVTEVANRLCLSVKTISTHKTRLMQKLSLANHADIIRFGMEHGLDR